jgi:amino acid adenylation domain-containing protein
MSVNPASLYELFQRTAVQFPDKEAILTGNGKSITYHHLATETEKIIGWCTQIGLQPHERVLLISDKQVLTISHALAVLACHCCIVPVDENIRQNQLKFLIDDVQPRLILSSQNLPDDALFKERFTKVTGNIGLLGYLNKETTPHHEKLAYILFTSGSTGQPKGVMLSHENILSFLRWAQHTFNFSSDEVFSGIAPLYFDLSLLDLFGALMCGGTVVLYGQQEVNNPRFLVQHIAQHGITNLYATPSTLRLMQQFGKAGKYQYPSLKRVLFAGEVFEPKALHQWIQQLPHTRFYNLYGPTESNVCSWYEIERPVDELRTQPYPIGKACEGMELRTDETTGELLIAGPQLTPGYWNRPELNAEKFITHEEKTWYRSGDRVQTENGNYVYEGRTDRMIKKRGYRVEPGHIESVLLQHTQVADTAVIGSTDADGYVFLTAFVSLHENHGDMVLPLKNYCAAFLPHYMIPERIIFITSLPKTGSGKTDYQALKQQL